ncbi:hypothetical protein MKW98_021619 [Papaver atlanticum]|uniref:Uncharacterized protein n=1 Tax=Papaver atlanticum TaxID=357466 RepID=A0AAD4XU07_9MAGN|nr:hypothetical protein MKW98_021619 [Papaver atlanticum]
MFTAFQAQRSNSMEVDKSLWVHTMDFDQSNTMEIDQSLGVLTEVVMLTDVIYPDQAPTPGSELTGIVEAVAEDETKAQVMEAEQQVVLAKEQLLALETKICPLLMERQNLIDKCSGGLLLLDCGTNLSLVTAPVENDAIMIEEPIDNINSMMVPYTGIA